jgi:hypothetical protein
MKLSEIKEVMDGLSFTSWMDIKIYSSEHEKPKVGSIEVRTYDMVSRCSVLHPSIAAALEHLKNVVEKPVANAEEVIEDDGPAVESLQAMGFGVAGDDGGDGGDE